MVLEGVRCEEASDEKILRLRRVALIKPSSWESSSLRDSSVISRGTSLMRACLETGWAGIENLRLCSAKSGLHTSWLAEKLSLKVIDLKRTWRFYRNNFTLIRSRN